MKVSFARWITRLSAAAMLTAALSLPASAAPSASEPGASESSTTLTSEFRDPPREFTLLPFWFWNDELSTDEIARQIDDFERHGVHGFTIHPRVGLPEDTGWMSAKLLDAMRFALEEARRRDMRVMLYDEGMYPSGSSAGQVVAEDPANAARGFVRAVFDSAGKQLEPRQKVGDDWILVEEYENAKGETVRIYDAPSGGVVRGLHYLGDESAKNPREFSPPASDLLYPPAVDAFIRLVYQRYYDEFREYFESGVVVGIFTDEPSILGRGPIAGMKNGSLRSLDAINRSGGCDFRPRLKELWEDLGPESAEYRARYQKAVQLALEELYYEPLSRWCREHHTSLCGHPESSGDIGVLNKFQIPGQDIVWRYIEPGAKAFDPVHSPMAKVASSAALHNGARRNLNEVFGAYGHELTYEETWWILNWCVVRGQNMFLPHAFYYSIRGPRWEERPPDVGPHSSWWDDYKTFADYSSRLCWLNTDSEVVAPTAILVDSGVASVWLTRELSRNQLDYNFLETRFLADASTTARYGVFLVPPRGISVESSALLERAASTGRLVLRSGDAERLGVAGSSAVLTTDDASTVAAVRELVGVDVATISSESASRGELVPAFPSLAPGLRVRHVVKGGVDFYLLFNEEESAIDVLTTFAADDGDVPAREWNPRTGEVADLPRNPANPRLFRLQLAPHATTIYSFR